MRKRGKILQSDYQNGKEIQNGHTHHDSTSATRKRARNSLKDGSQIENNISIFKAIAAFLLIVLFFGPMYYASNFFIRVGLVKPKLDNNTSVNEFCEERALKHVNHLSKKIGFRQEGSKGLLEAKKYIIQELHKIKSSVGPRLRIEIDDSVVSGSFNLFFLFKNMTLGYQNLSNIAVRISDSESNVHNESNLSLLINSHFDSALHSQGASDCAACVSVMLETIRQIAESDYVPNSPLIFLFNGGEEIFLKAAHGFLNHEWMNNVGALINLESSGSSFPDHLVQSGPGSWPSKVYATSARHPMGNSLSQDIFYLIPGDTDYRIFSTDFQNISGIDLIFILKGYFYHTKLDNVENLTPGALQLRGDNLFSLIRGFLSAKEMQKNYIKNNKEINKDFVNEKNSVFFDLWGMYMVHYSWDFALLLHFSLFIIIFSFPFISSYSNFNEIVLRYKKMMQGAIFYIFSFLFGTLSPPLLSFVVVSLHRRGMSWYSSPILSYAIYFPVSFSSLLFFNWVRITYFFKKEKNERDQDFLIWSDHFGGTIFLNALICMIISLLGGRSSYIFFFWTLFLFPCFFIFKKFQKWFGKSSPLCLIAFMIPSAFPTAYMLHFFNVFVHFLTEKMGVVGTSPHPYGLYLPDLLLSFFIGFCTSFSLLPILIFARKFLCRPPIILLFFFLSLTSATIFSQKFPYDDLYIKRLILQRQYWTKDGVVLQSAFNFASTDGNDAAFVFQHAPQLFDYLALEKTKTVLQKNLFYADPKDNLGWFPISSLVHRTLSTLLAEDKSVFPASFTFPNVDTLTKERTKQSRERIHLRIQTGSLSEVWSVVLNASGPITSWSFANGELPNTENEYHIAHLSGGNGRSVWEFWIERGEDERVNLEMAVLDQALDVETKRLVDVFPSWVGVGASSVYLSHYNV